MSKNWGKRNSEISIHGVVGNVVWMIVCEVIRGSR